MLENKQMQTYKQALKAAEDWGQISSINLANVHTIGYKKLVGSFQPECCEDGDFDGVMERTQQLQLNITQDKSKGKTIQLNGEQIEASNVSPTDELKNLVHVANMTRSILTAVQIENRIQQDIINLQTR